MASNDFPSARPDEVGLDPRFVDIAEQMMDDQVSSGRSPGVAAVVIRRGRVVLDKAVGTRDLNGSPMTTDTVFPIASATKPITATVLLTLVEEGRIGLNQQVSDYLGEISSEAGDGLLVHHLLTHTGGYEVTEQTGAMQRRVAECGAADSAFDRDPLVNAVLGGLSTMKRRKRPGEVMLYNSTGYEMLGEIIRRVTGSSVGQVMKERVFDPLAMTDTAMVPGPALSERMIERASDAPLGARDLNRLFGCTEDEFRDSDLAGGGVVSTPSDYLRFCEMIRKGGELAGERVLSKASWRSMTTNQIPGVGDLTFRSREAMWGFGLSVLGSERWPYFGGGLVSPGSVRHAGAGGIDHWVDFDAELCGCYFEIITEMSDMMEPISSAGHRFQDVIAASVVD